MRFSWHSYAKIRLEMQTCLVSISRIRVDFLSYKEVQFVWNMKLSSCVTSCSSFLFKNAAVLSLHRVYREVKGSPALTTARADGWAGILFSLALVTRGEK